MIRPAEAKDITPCWQLIQEFYDLSMYRGIIPPDERKCRRLLAHCAGSPRAFLWVADINEGVEGALAGMTAEATWGRAKVLNDLFFYVRKPAHGWGGMLGWAYQKWAHTQNIKAWGFSLASGNKDLNEKAQALAQALNLTHAGGTYIEVFTSCPTH